MNFGCHISIKNGYLGAAKKALKMDAQAFQYFPKNPRSLTLKEFDYHDANNCKVFCRENLLVSVAHTPYPTDLTAEKKKRTAVRDSLLNDLEIAEACGSVGVVVHFGSKTDSEDPLASYQLMIEMLNMVISKWDGSCKILLENNAGRPGNIGTTFEELVQVRKLSADPDKIGFCFDTCHAFACSLWNGENWHEVVAKGKKLHYWDHLEVIHLNNSKYGTGIGKDRHANIFSGGYIKEEQFDEMFQTPLLKDIPLILETPTKLGVTHAEEIAQLNERWTKG